MVYTNPLSAGQLRSPGSLQITISGRRWRSAEQAPCLSPSVPMVDGAPGWGVLTALFHEL